MDGGSLIVQEKRVTAVRPNKHEAKKILAPMDGGLGGHGMEAHDGHNEDEGAKSEWEELADKYNKLEEKVRDHLDDQQNEGIRGPPVVSALPRMSKDERERHQVTHTPYSPSCKHCVAARAVRHRHPMARKHKYLVRDVDGSREAMNWCMARRQ